MRRKCSSNCDDDASLTISKPRQRWRFAVAQLGQRRACPKVDQDRAVFTQRMPLSAFEQPEPPGMRKLLLQHRPRLWRTRHIQQ